MTFGKSRAKVHTDSKRRTTFRDVAGADEEKEELREIVDFLKNPRNILTGCPYTQRGIVGGASRYGENPVGQGCGR